jgi:hypothetical protein
MWGPFPGQFAVSRISALLLIAAFVGASAAAAIPFETRDGHTVEIPDFTKGRTPTYSEPGTSYFHLVADTDISARGFQIQASYGRVSKVTIALVKRPFGATRRAAEHALRAFFPLPTKTLCRLDIEVSIPGPVDEALSTKTLGLSFCPGAMVLP